LKSFAEAKRVVVKIGTTTLTHKSGLLNHRRLNTLVQILADLKNSGREVIVVTSGAVGVGMGELGFSQRPKDMPTIQACAALGQSELMYTYDKLFGEYKHKVAQILLTRDVVEEERRKRNVTNTFDRLLELGVIPIVNENDTVSVEELEFGDNDTLSAIVAVLVKADGLVLLSDTDGMYTADPKKDPTAKLIPVVEDIDAVMDIAGGPGAFGKGGMITKVHAAKKVCAEGIDMVIINGAEPMLLYDLFDGKSIGTYFRGGKNGGV
jgi:glutamate 5-kinase